MQNPGVYKIPCSCGKSYVWQSGRAIEVRIKVHEKDIDYKRTGRSAVTEHVEQKADNINFCQVKILSKKTNYG